MMENTQLNLTEDMQMFDYWSGVYSPADRHIDSLRAAYDAFQQHYTLPRTEQMMVEDHMLQLATHQINMRVFYPAELEPEAAWSWIFYIHGGGNVVGSADSHEYIARQLARDLKVKVFLAEYGLVPEFDWQQGQQDCQEVYQTLLMQAKKWNIFPQGAAIVADGSAVAIALQLQQQLESTSQPLAQALIFPSFMPQQSAVGQISSLLYQVEDQQLMQAWTGVSAQHAPRCVPNLVRHCAKTFVALPEFDLSAEANAVLLQQLQKCSNSVEQHTGLGLRGNCLPLLRDCHAVANIYQQLLQFLSISFNNIDCSSI